jgi:hypothetical protein
MAEGEGDFTALRIRAWLVGVSSVRLSVKVWRSARETWTRGFVTCARERAMSAR